MAATPLGLWLLRTVYLASHTDPRPLLTSEVAHNATMMQAHSFDQLIPALLITRPASHNDERSSSAVRWRPLAQFSDRKMSKRSCRPGNDSLAEFLLTPPAHNLSMIVGVFGLDDLCVSGGRPSSARFACDSWILAIVLVIDTWRPFACKARLPC